MNDLAGLAVLQIRETSKARTETAAWRELACAALALLAERDRDLQAAKANNRHLVEQLRAQRQDQPA